MKRNRIKVLAIALATGAMPLVTAGTCNPYTGGFEFFRDDDGDWGYGGDYYADVYVADPYYYDDGYYHDDYYYDDWYYEEPYYDDCFFCW